MVWRIGQRTKTSCTQSTRDGNRGEIVSMDGMDHACPAECRERPTEGHGRAFGCITIAHSLTGQPPPSGMITEGTSPI